MARQTTPGRQATRTLQTLRGSGKVYAGNEFQCDVRYSVAVRQVIVHSGSQPRAGATDISGNLMIVDGQRSWKPGTKLSLKMEDGRTAACVITSDDAPASTFAIRVTDLSDRP